MKQICLFIIVGALLCSSCATFSKPQDRTNDEAMLDFLPYLNQKVAGYLDAHPECMLDSESYKKIVNEECGTLPRCGKDAAILFKTYNVQSQKLDGMFSVMLCDKEIRTKVMEDFSCNEQKVEIPSYQIIPKGDCQFEPDWRNKIAIDCPEVK
jgi:hypothetical protein